MTDQPLSQLERVADTFIAPTKTFTDILRDQSWWLPFVLIAVVSYGFLFTVQTKVGWNTVVENTLRQDPKAAERMANATPEGRAQARKFTLAIIKYTFYASPLLAIISAAFIALILWGTISGVFGGKTTFGHVFAVWMYGTLPVLIKSLLVIIALLAGLDADAFNLSNPVGTNAGYFLPADSAKWLMTLATSIDITWLWSLALVGIGLAIVSRVKRSLGLAAVFGWWVLILVVRVGYAAFAG